MNRKELGVKISLGVYDHLFISLHLKLFLFSLHIVNEQIFP